MTETKTTAQHQRELKEIIQSTEFMNALHKAHTSDSEQSFLEVVQVLKDSFLK
jgi:hypothetical protein